MSEPEHPGLVAFAAMRSGEPAAFGVAQPTQGESLLPLSLMRLIDDSFSRRLGEPPDGASSASGGLCRQAQEVSSSDEEGGLRAVYQQPKNDHPHPEQKIWPLRDLVIDWPH